MREIKTVFALRESPIEGERRTVSNNASYGPTDS